MVDSISSYVSDANHWVAAMGLNQKKIINGSIRMEQLNLQRVRLKYLNHINKGIKLMDRNRKQLDMLPKQIKHRVTLIKNIKTGK